MKMFTKDLCGEWREFPMHLKVTYQSLDEKQVV